MPSGGGARTNTVICGHCCQTIKLIYPPPFRRGKWVHLHGKEGCSGKETDIIAARTTAGEAR